MSMKHVYVYIHVPHRYCIHDKHSTSASTSSLNREDSDVPETLLGNDTSERPVSARLY